MDPSARETDAEAGGALLGAAPAIARLRAGHRVGSAAGVRVGVRVGVAVTASVVVHAACLGALALVDGGTGWLRSPRAARVSDVPRDDVGGVGAATVLSLEGLEPIEPPRAAEPEPEPEPEPDPVPEPVAVAAAEPAPAEPTARSRDAGNASWIPEEAAQTPLSPVSPPARNATAVPPNANATKPAPATSSPAVGSPAPVTFAGAEASTRARDVIYVVDASGAMVTTLAFAKAELARSIASLDASQRFQIVIARRLGDTSRLDRFPSDGPSRATDDAKAAVGPFLAGVRAGGRAAPLEGLREALAERPDLVLVLTANFRRSAPAASDPWYSSVAADPALSGAYAAEIAPALTELDALNPVRRDPLGRGPAQRATVIKAVQFLGDDPTGMLQAVAERHGDGPGSYRVMTLAEMGGGGSGVEEGNATSGVR